MALSIKITYETELFLFLVKTHGHVRVPAVFKPMDVVGRVVTLYYFWVSVEHFKCLQ